MIMFLSSSQLVKENILLTLLDKLQSEFEDKDRFLLNEISILTFQDILKTIHYLLF